MEFKLKLCMRYLLAFAFVGIGGSHFTNPEPFVSIMPPYLAWHLELVYVSGIFEILGGAGLLIPRLRTPAAWGLLALLLAVYPVNIHMLMNEVYIDGMVQEKWVLWARMPLQFVLGLGVAWVGGIWPRRQQINTLHINAPR